MPNAEAFPAIGTTGPAMLLLDESDLAMGSDNETTASDASEHGVCDILLATRQGGWMGSTNSMTIY